MLSEVFDGLRVFFFLLILFLMAFGTTQSIMDPKLSQYWIHERIWASVMMEWSLTLGDFSATEQDDMSE